MAEVDVFDTFAIFERRWDWFNLVVLEIYATEMGQFFEEVIIKWFDLVVLQIEIMKTVLLFQWLWQLFQTHFLKYQLLDELQST